jgi:uncharacterized protein DUF6516
MNLSLPDIPIARGEYEEFIYTIREHAQSIRISTLVLKMIATHKAEVECALYFANDVRLEVSEAISFDEQRIETYGYEVYRGEERLYWYDSQPHPHEPSLASTHPHHKHVPPDIKHHRVPAPGLSFTRANLPWLIEEIQASLLSIEAVD